MSFIKDLIRVSNHLEYEKKIADFMLTYKEDDLNVMPVDKFAEECTDNFKKTITNIII